MTFSEQDSNLKPGLHISRKNRTHMLRTGFVSFPRMPWSSHSNDIKVFIFHKKYLQLILKLSLQHNRKHVVRLLRLYEKQAN